MTGWRLGFVCAPKEISAAMLKIHQYALDVCINNGTICRIPALQHGMQDVERMRRSYRRRRNYIVKSFNEIGLDCHKPGGAFYVSSIRKSRIILTGIC